MDIVRLLVFTSAPLTEYEYSTPFFKRKEVHHNVTLVILVQYSTKSTVGLQSS